MYKGFSLRKDIVTKKRLWIALLAASLLLIIVLTQSLMYYFIRRNVQIADVFLDSEVATSTSSIEMAGEYVTKSLSKEQKDQVLFLIANQIGLEMESSDITYSSEAKISQASVHRKGKSASTNIQLVSVNVNEEGEIPVIQNYIMVRMEVYNNISSIMNYKKLIGKAFEKLEITEDSSYIQFTGKYPGQLTLDSKNAIANQMIQRLNGKVTYENRADDMNTVYAYSGNLKEYISVGKSKVNIQVAMSYDEADNETIVYLATPIMNGAY